MYTKFTYSYYSMYLLYCIRLVNCIRFPLKSCINGENCAIDSHVYIYMKLFKFEIQKCDQILCAHKPYFLMLGHIYSRHLKVLSTTSTYDQQRTLMPYYSYILYTISTNHVTIPIPYSRKFRKVKFSKISKKIILKIS